MVGERCGQCGFDGFYGLAGADAGADPRQPVVGAHLVIVVALFDALGRQQLGSTNVDLRPSFAAVFVRVKAARPDVDGRGHVSAAFQAFAQTK